MSQHQSQRWGHKSASSWDPTSPTPPLEESQLIHGHHLSWQSSEMLTKEERKVWLSRGTFTNPKPSLQDTHTPPTLQQLPTDAPAESEPSQVSTSPNAAEPLGHTSGTRRLGTRGRSTVLTRVHLSDSVILQPIFSVQLKDLDFH